MSDFKGRFILVCFLVLLFCGWAWLTFSGALTAFDSQGLLLFRDEALAPIGDKGLQDLMVLVTHAGDTITLILLSLMALGWLYWRGDRAVCLYGALSIAGLFLLNPILKTLFGRARPDIVDHLVHASSNSFPSGHALRAAGIYFLLYFLLVNRLPVKINQTLFFTVSVLAISTSISRVYLGVHWPSDIIASWLLATIWVVAWHQKLTTPNSGVNKS